MKICPVCGATYSARISFCFEDGAVLVANEAAVATQAAGSGGAARPAAPPVPSRVATPVSPARRGRSLLSSKGSPLSFSPPQASTEGRRQKRQAPPPAPLQPLDIPEEALKEEADVAPANLAQGDQAMADALADAPPAPAGPTPADAGGHVTPPTTATESTYDELDFPEMGVGTQEEDRRALPPWLLPALAGAAALVVVVGAVVGGAVGLLGTGALSRDDGTQVANVDPQPEPVAAPLPAPEPATEPVPVPVAAAPTPVTPSPAAAERPAEPQPVPAAPEPAPEPAVADVAEPESVEPAPEPDDGSPWGEIQVPTAKVSFTSVPAGATVLIDGDEAGQTPFTMDVDHGDHDIEVVLDGHDGETRTVTVGGGNLDLLFELTATARTGNVIVVLEGWDGAVLYVDGEKSGVLPARIQLTEGSHEFKVESSSGTQSVTRDVEFAEGEVTIVNLSG